MAWDRGRSKLGECCYECHKQNKAFEGCHAVCSKYLEARKEYDEMQAKIRASKEADNSFYVYKMGRIKSLAKSRTTYIAKKNGRI